MKTLAGLAVLFLGANAAGPDIPDDFTAEVTVTEFRDTHKVTFEGHLEESFTWKKSKISAEGAHEHGGHFTMLRLFSDKKEYEIAAGRGCEEKKLDDEMHPAFSWAKNATKLDHECHAAHGEGSGILFMREHETKTAKMAAALCVDKDMKTPYWVEVRAKTEKGEGGRFIGFKKFDSGEPDPDAFVVPGECKK